MREPMTEAELDRARECEHECSVMERGVVSGLVAEVERLRAVTVAYWARFGAVPEDGENILAKREADARRAAEARIAELEEALIDVAVKCEDLWGRAMNLDGWQLRREVDAIKLRAEAAKPTPPPAVEQGDAFICPMGHSETHYGADMEDERPCCDKCGRRMVPAPSPAPAEPLAKVDAALNRVMEGETMTATASDDGSGHVTVKVATENPAHATSRGACERCGGAGTVQEPRYHASGKMLGVVFVPCPAKCSPPAAAKDEQPRREAIEECRQVCLDRARRCRADGETAYANAYEMAADLIGGLLDTPAAAKDDRVRTPSVEEIDKACRDHDDAIRAQARREMNEACARFVEAGAELNRIPMWMVREKLAEGIRALLDTPAAPTLDFVGPCVHGRDPYDRCEGCGMLTPEQARAVAEAEDFR